MDAAVSELASSESEADAGGTAELLELTLPYSELRKSDPSVEFGLT